VNDGTLTIHVTECSEPIETRLRDGLENYGFGLHTLVLGFPERVVHPLKYEALVLAVLNVFPQGTNERTVPNTVKFMCRSQSQTWQYCGREEI
jgi:hypothetical protein